MKPFIGVTTNYRVKNPSPEFATPHDTTDVFNLYPNAVERAGGVPTLMPFYNDPENIKTFVEKLDGLLVVGGDDIDPMLYGEDVIKECCSINYTRDKQEMALLKYVINETKIPVLAVCRGHQMLNVSMGGSLEQDNKHLGFYHSTLANADLGNTAHMVYFEPGSRIAGIIGKDKLAVNSYHHQNIKALAPGLVCTGKAHDIEKGCPYDMIETIELPGDRFVLGVQWHPEMLPNIDDHQKIYRAFVKACAEYKANK